jgi:hypothetical protein
MNKQIRATTHATVPVYHKISFGMMVLYSSVIIITVTVLLLTFPIRVNRNATSQFSTTLTTVPSNWKTYTNKVAGYELMYPPHFNESCTNTSYPYEFSKNNMNITIIIPGEPCGPLFEVYEVNNLNKLSLLEIWKYFLTTDVNYDKSSHAPECDKQGKCTQIVIDGGKEYTNTYKYSTILLDNKEAVKVNCVRSFGICRMDEIYVNGKENKVLVIESHLDEKQSVNTSQILSTFKFTK